jgi:hypothetical protein
MLTITDIPKEISDLYAQSKEKAKEIIATVMSDATPERSKNNAVLNTAYPGTVIAVQKGMLKYFYNDKFIRFYSGGDIVSLGGDDCSSIKLLGEFSADLLVMPQDVFARKLSDPGDLSLWLHYQQMVSRIMHALCSCYISEGFNPKIDIRQFNAGDVIIQEGTPPDCLFEMIEGRAVVTIKEHQVGLINQGEVFGEISFLTASPRTASVLADTGCMVQAISGDDFEKIVKYRPQLIFALSKTLGKRLVEVNEKLVRIMLT